jgi:choline-sulfatase
MATSGMQAASAMGRVERPLNVLWLMSDQHAAGALGCYGNRIVRTPRLDRLAAEGLRFERAYCSYPVCVPARFTMLTGRYPHHTGCTGNHTPLPLRERTVAHHFSAAGYATAFIGKMHPVDAQTHGFDYYVDFGHYYDYLGPRTEVYVLGMGAGDTGAGMPWLSMYFERPDRASWNALRPERPRGPGAIARALEPAQVLPEEDHFESFVARETIRFLRTYRDEPLFVVASLLKPHAPFAPPPEYRALYSPDEIPLPRWPAGHLDAVPAQSKARPIPGAGTPAGDAIARQFLTAYYGNVSHLDECCGRILDALDELGLRERTLVLYTTDHGEMAYEHGLHGKGNFFDGAARIPLIARLPGVVPAGTATRALVDQGDFVPTLLELCGVAPAPRSRPLDGASFAPVLRDPSSRGKPFAFGEYALGSGRPFYMLRDERWKYIYYTAGELREQLYDLENDPGEFTNLALDPGHRPTCERLRAQLFTFLGDAAPASA